MSKKEQDTLFFISWCVEQYKIHVGMTGSDTMALFDQYGVTEYLEKSFDVLHTQGRQWLMEEIDEVIAERKEAEA